jgi:RNA polymerase sigma-70 factor (ECF subfamily)
MVNPADTPDDDALVRLIRDEAGRPAGARALNDLLDRWQKRIYLWAWKRVRDREEALDLTQDCLVLMTRGLAGYEPRGHFGAWVFTIVRHRCLSAVRPRVLARDPDLDLETLVGSGPGPERETEQRDLEEHVLRAMQEALEPRERIALWLRAYEGSSVEEITRTLSLDGASGARGLLQTARRKLRAALAALGEDA